MRQTPIRIAVVLIVLFGSALGAATAAAKVQPPPPPVFFDPPWQIGTTRITQGLDHDYSANVDYDKIAGKDVLVRVVPTITAPARDDALTPTSESCTVTQLTQLFFGVEIPVNRPPVHVAADEAPYQGALIDTTGTPYTNLSAPKVDCWVPGSAVFQPGRYSFSMTIATKGRPQPITRSLTSGVLFVASAPINVLLMPWQHAPEDSNYAPFSTGFYANLVRVAQQLDRVWPVPTGVAPLNIDGLHPASAGLHVTYGAPFICPSGTDFGTCDADARAQAQDQLAYWNASAQKLDHQDGRTRDQFSYGSTVGAVANLAGGQSCWFNKGEDVAGSDLGAQIDDNSSFIITQEITHCFGLVDPNSPNINPSSAAHSKNYTIATSMFNNVGSLVGMLDHRDYGTVYSLMFPVFGPGNANTNMFEGYEWNEMRQKAIAHNADLFQFFGQLLDADVAVNRAGTDAQLIYAGRATLDDIAPTPAAPGSDYSVAFLDANGSVVASQPVSATFDNTAHENEPVAQARNVDLHLPIPPGATEWQLRHRDDVQIAEPLDETPPTLGRLAATTDPAANVIHLRWDASGARFYRVFFQATPTTPAMLVANGLTSPAYDVPSDFLAPTTTGRFTVVASNGDAITTADAGVAVNPPTTATIVGGPTPGTAATAGTPVTFSALAMHGVEPITDEHDVWSVDGRRAGTGLVFTTAFSEGPHSVELTVTGTDPRSVANASTSVTIGPSPSP